MTLYKFLNAGGQPAYGGSGQWNLPHGKRPGKWMPKITGDIVPCENGYHLCEEKDLLEWVADELYVAEYRGEMVADEMKIVVREARLLYRVTNWNERTARLFSCDCAERALKLIGDKADPRSVESVRVARLFAVGKATRDELAAARAAARAAAWDAAWAAARAAAGAAARDSAGAAARAAAGAAAGAAARDAAGAAARAAAWDAAWDAERKWQTERLMWYLEGENE